MVFLGFIFVYSLHFFRREGRLFDVAGRHKELTLLDVIEIKSLRQPDL